MAETQSEASQSQDIVEAARLTNYLSPTDFVLAIKDGELVKILVQDLKRIV